VLPGLFVLVRLPTGFMCAIGLLGCLPIAVCGILLPYLFGLMVGVLMIDLCWSGCCLFGLFVPVQPLNFSDCFSLLCW
jgi:hypothetical protein